MPVCAGDLANGIWHRTCCIYRRHLRIRLNVCELNVFVITDSPVLTSIAWVQAQKAALTQAAAPDQVLALQSSLAGSISLPDPAERLSNHPPASRNPDERAVPTEAAEVLQPLLQEVILISERVPEDDRTPMMVF